MRTALSVCLRHLRSFLVLGLIVSVCCATPGAFGKEKKDKEKKGEAATETKAKADKPEKEKADKPEAARAEDEAAGNKVVIADEAALLTVLNKADEKTLCLLPGIGEVTAKAIVAARPIAALDDLLKVKGIAEKRLEKIKSAIGKTKVPADAVVAEATE